MGSSRPSVSLLNMHRTIEFAWYEPGTVRNLVKPLKQVDN